MQSGLRHLGGYMELSKQFMFYNFFELIMIKFKKNANFPSLGVITDYKRINKETPIGLALISKGINNGN